LPPLLAQGALGIKSKASFATTVVVRKARFATTVDIGGEQIGKGT